MRNLRQFVVSSQAIFVFYVVQYEPLTYGKTYQYPMWAQGIGIGISFSSMVWIPAYAVYYMIKSKGTIKEVGGTL